MELAVETYDNLKHKDLEELENDVRKPQIELKKMKIYT